MRRHPSLSGWAPSLIFSLSIFATSIPGFAQTDTLTADTVKETPVKTASAEDKAEERYMALIDSADIYMKNERWRSAEGMLRKALRMKPAIATNYLLFSNLGVCLSAQERYGEALEAFDIGLVRHPSDPRILTSRAKTLLSMRRYGDAENDLSAALLSDSTMLDARRLRGQIRLLNRKVDLAADDFRQLMRLHPNEPWGPAGLADCLRIQENYDEALPLYRDALSIETEPERRGDIYIAIVAVLLRQDALADTDDTLREAIKELPRRGELYMMRSVLHHRRYQNDDAEIDKKIAVDYGVDPQIIEDVLRSFEP